MKNIKWILLATIICLLISCETLPDSANLPGKSIVLFHVERSKNDSADTFAEYSLVYDKYMHLRASPKTMFNITTNVLPGKHTINSVRVNYITSGKYANDNASTIYFETKAGYITILPIKMVVTIERDSNKKITFQRYEIKPMEKSDIYQCMQFLNSQKNISGWKILE